TGVQTCALPISINDIGADDLESALGEHLGDRAPAARRIPDQGTVEVHRISHLLDAPARLHIPAVLRLLICALAGGAHAAALPSVFFQPRERAKLTSCASV